MANIKEIKEKIKKIGIKTIKFHTSDIDNSTIFSLDIILNNKEKICLEPDTSYDMPYIKIDKYLSKLKDE